MHVSTSKGDRRRYEEELIAPFEKTNMENFYDGFSSPGASHATLWKKIHEARTSFHLGKEVDPSLIRPHVLRS